MNPFKKPHKQNKTEKSVPIYDIIDDWKLVRMTPKGIGDPPVIRSLFSDFLFALVIVAVSFIFFSPAIVDGPSMEPTFVSGDYLIISRITAWTSGIKHGDVVACKINDGGKNITIIKRVAAMEGDSVEVRDSTVFVNGEQVYQYSDGTVFSSEDRELVLGKDEYFVIGDNSSESFDSRMFGTLEKKRVIAKVFMRVYPFNRFELF